MRSTPRWLARRGTIAIVLSSIVAGAMIGVEVLDVPPAIAFLLGLFVAGLIEDVVGRDRA